jgi:hypothetical protein
MYALSPSSVGSYMDQSGGLDSFSGLERTVIFTYMGVARMCPPIILSNVPKFFVM